MAFFETWPVWAPLLTLSALLLLAACLASAAYNVYFHPLRNYPGPRLWAATHLIWVYYRVTGKLVWKAIDLHREYGSVVRVSPNQLSYITETAWNPIYGHRPIEMQKNCLAGFSKPGLPKVHSILSADHANHARLRRVLAPGLSGAAVNDQEQLMLKHATLLIKRLVIHSAEDSMDLNQWFEWATLDLVSDIICGEPAGALEEEDASPWLDILTSSIQSQVWLQALELYGLTAWCQFLLPKHMVNAAFENFHIIDAKVRVRLSKRNSRKDFFSYILRHNEKLQQAGISPKEMTLNAATIIGAGTGTTATWLSTTIYNLCSNETAYQQLVEEIRYSIREEGDITLNKISKFPYLAAVMKESLRLHSPSPSSLGRFVPSSGEMIDGRFVPGGTTVGIHHHAAYHSPSNFHRPDDFCPERWLPSARNSESPFSSDRLGVMRPFSYGPRICLGIKLAQAETQIILVKLLWNFNVELLPESIAWQRSAKGTVAWHRQALKCKLAIAEES